MRLKPVVCLFALNLCASVAFAQYQEIYRIDQVAKDFPEDHCMSAVATSLGISSDTLKQEKAQYKSTCGELYIAHQIAKAGKLDFKSMMTEARGGKTWGVLAKEKNVDMEPITKSSKEFEDTLKGAQKKASAR